LHAHKTNTKMDLEHAALLCSSVSNYQSPSTGALVPSIHPSTTFSRDDEYRAHRTNSNGGEEQQQHSFVYSRADNPSLHVVESVLSKLDEAEESCLFSSGMAAVSAIMNALFVPDCVVFFPRRSYFLNRKYFREWCTRQHVRIVQYDTDESSLEYLKLAIEMVSCEAESAHEKFMWIETPANSSWEVLDIATVTGWCRENGVTSFVDATVLTPLLCQPLKLGADFVLHSCSKYLNGHSDVLAGVVSCKDRTSKHWKRIKEARVTGGAVLSAFDCFLLARGMRTLHLRVPKASENGMHVAKSMLQFTFKGEKGEKVVPSAGEQNMSAAAMTSTTSFPISPWFKLVVLYPGLPEHVNHAISKQQQAGKNQKMFGGMLSVVITPILPDQNAKPAMESENATPQTNNNGETNGAKNIDINDSTPRKETDKQENAITTTTTTTEGGGGANMPPAPDSHAIKMHNIAFEMAKTTATLTKIWRPATSLGGPESLIEHRASVEGGAYPWSQCPAGLLRLSCGLEPGHRLARDLKSALHAAHLKVCRAHGLIKTSQASKPNAALAQPILAHQIVQHSPQVPQQPVVSRNILHGALGALTSHANDKKRPYPENTAEEAHKRAMTPEAAQKSTPEPVGNLSLDIPVGSLEEPKLVKIRKPRKPAEKTAPAPDDQRCCKKSTQWHCPKFRFGATKYCENHQDCVLKDLEGPKKRGRKPSLGTQAAMAANGVPMGAAHMSVLGATAGTALTQMQPSLTTPMQVSQQPMMAAVAAAAAAATTTTAAPPTISGRPEQPPDASNPGATAPPTGSLAETAATIPTPTTQGSVPLAQNVPQNVPPPSPPKNDGIFTSGDLDMPISMMVTDSGKVNLQLAMDAQVRMNKN